MKVKELMEKLKNVDPDVEFSYDLLLSLEGYKTKDQYEFHVDGVKEIE